MPFFASSTWPLSFQVISLLLCCPQCEEQQIMKTLFLRSLTAAYSKFSSLQKNFSQRWQIRQGQCQLKHRVQIWIAVFFCSLLKMVKWNRCDSRGFNKLHLCCNKQRVHFQWLYVFLNERFNFNIITSEHCCTCPCKFYRLSPESSVQFTDEDIQYRNIQVLLKSRCLCLWHLCGTFISLSLAQNSCNQEPVEGCGEVCGPFSFGYMATRSLTLSFNIPRYKHVVVLTEMFHWSPNITPRACLSLIYEACFQVVGKSHSFGECAVKGPQGIKWITNFKY